MMLQTLVENAIKHGISKAKEGGTIKIISDFRFSHHELIVQNSGTISEIADPEGFGLQSTRSRLKLLFGDKASFTIEATKNNIVEAKIIMPVQGVPA
jgi:LytS/YehU family sensor histidine kinase